MFVPQSVEGLEQLSLSQLTDAAQGWTYDAERQEIIVKLIPTASSGVIVIK
jgi:hypothetical protein